jgi:hypothetical protein
MRTCTVTLESNTPYSQSRHYETPKLNKESANDYEARTWKDRLHTDESGTVFIPPMSFKNCLSEVAKYLSVQIPGKGKSTYTKHIEAGILVLNPVPLGVKKEDVAGEWLFVPADGKRGGSRRVKKCFPVIPKWKANVEFLVIDDVVTKETFEYHLTQAGSFIGVGRFRPRNNGFYGRFTPTAFKWAEV